MSMSRLLARYAREKTPVQIRFKADLQAHGGPLGPGELSCVDLEGDDSGELFSFDMPVMVSNGSGPAAMQREVILPISFAASDVLWVSTGPRESDRPQVVTRGGLRLP